MTPEEIRDSGIMAGMTVHEINAFMDDEFRNALLNCRSYASLHKAVSRIWRLTGNALMYAHSDGLYKAALSRASKESND